MSTTEFFFKYQGLGNDFIVLDRRQSGEDIDADTSRWLCDRRLGIGTDGVLALLPSAAGLARMVVHNADGSIAEMCGNGLRCAVKYLVDNSGEKPERVAPTLPSGATQTPFLAAPVPGHPGLTGHAISMGNPHLVLLDQPLEDASRLGPVLERHPGFVDRTNVEFVRVDEDGLTVVVWERGCGLTQACGTGACAAAVAAVLAKRRPADAWSRVSLPGGDLLIRVPSDLSDIRMRGPVAFVFTGVVPDAPGR